MTIRAAGTTPTFPAEALRAQFPALQRAGSFVFFDNAAGAQVPQSVLDAVNDHAFPLDVAVTSSGAPDLTVHYYEINLGGFLVAAPVPFGHYSVSGLSVKTGTTPPPGVNFQTQVAP